MSSIKKYSRYIYDEYDDIKFGNKNSDKIIKNKKNVTGDVANSQLLRYSDRMSNYLHIVKGVRERHAPSQLMFYDLFIRLVYRTSHAIVGDEGEAEEIAQDTMLKVFDRTDLLNEDPGIMERVLRRMAANAAIDATRRRRDFIFVCDEIPDFEDTGSDDDGPDFSVAEIKEAISMLSGHYQSILSLRLFEEMSFAEMAELLAINYSTVRVQYIRGIAKLKKCLINKKNYA